MRGSYGIKKGLVSADLWSVVELRDGLVWPVISVKDETVAKALMDVLLKAENQGKL